MYHSKFNLFVLVVLLLSFGCAKEQLQPEQRANLSTSSEKDFKIQTVDVEAAMEEMDRLSAANAERLAQTASSRSCMETVKVPEDVATIQEAVDLACDGGDIVVSAGEYAETVFIDKPGLKIKANNGVNLTGGFYLLNNADETVIQKFNIIAIPSTPDLYIFGIHVFNNSNSQIIQNSLTRTTIRLINTSDIKVTNNKIKDVGNGIWLVASPGENCHRNIISKNTISGVFNSGIINLQGNCDDNIVNNNLILDNPILTNAAILLNSNPFDFSHNCDNNKVMNNTIENTTAGIWLFGPGGNNEIGPNNSVTESDLYGFIINGEPAIDNKIFNNTFLDNELCDIVISSAELLETNEFSNNEYDCLEEL